MSSLPVGFGICLNSTKLPPDLFLLIVRSLPYSAVFMLQCVSRCYRRALAQHEEGLLCNSVVTAKEPGVPILGYCWGCPAGVTTLACLHELLSRNGLCPACYHRKPGAKAPLQRCLCGGCKECKASESLPAADCARSDSHQAVMINGIAVLPQSVTSWRVYCMQVLGQYWA